MITVRLVREGMSPTEPTLGRLYFDGGDPLYTVEDSWLGNRHGVSCIPCGTYRLIISKSNKFQRPLPEILGVPDRDGIRIHGAIDANSVTGCVGVGTARADDGSLLHGFAASNGFKAWLTDALLHDKVQIEITVGGA